LYKQARLFSANDEGATHTNSGWSVCLIGLIVTKRDVKEKKRGRHEVCDDTRRMVVSLVKLTRDGIIACDEYCNRGCAEAVGDSFHYPQLLLRERRAAKCHFPSLTSYVSKELQNVCRPTKQRRQVRSRRQHKTRN
jgi:hypothetical protein